MSLMRCDQHDRVWDSDWLEECPLCVWQAVESVLKEGPVTLVDESSSTLRGESWVIGHITPKSMMK